MPREDKDTHPLGGVIMGERRDPFMGSSTDPFMGHPGDP